MLVQGTLSQHEERVVNAMQSLGDPTRYKMFKLLQQDSKLCVSEIAQNLGISVPAASQHFRIFEYVGIVSKQRNGQKICYELKRTDPLVQKLVHLKEEL